MRVFALTAGFLLFLVTHSAIAADSTKKPDEPAPGSSVEMPYLVAPLADGETLVAYAYVSCKIVGTSPSAAIDIRDKTPFLQDAFVRDVNASSIGRKGEPAAVDAPALQARLLAQARRIMGPGKVSDLKLIQIQITPLKPGSVPSANPM
jgi:hypothetical protein